MASVLTWKRVSLLLAIAVVGLLLAVGIVLRSASPSGTASAAPSSAVLGAAGGSSGENIIIVPPVPTPIVRGGVITSAWISGFDRDESVLVVLVGGLGGADLILSGFDPIPSTKPDTALSRTGVAGANLVIPAAVAAGNYSVKAIGSNGHVATYPVVIAVPTPTPTRTPTPVATPTPAATATSAATATPTAVPK